MSSGLVTFVAVIYFIVAIDQLLKGNWPMAGVWTSYALANLFMIKSLS